MATYQGTDDSDFLAGEGDDDTLIGRGGDDFLSGNGGNDYLAGDGGDDNLLGGDGDDWLEGGDGDDTLDGGAHEWGDGASYSSAVAAVNVDLSAGIATGGGGTDTLLNIEQIAGSPYADRLSGDANDNYLVGDDGDDTLAGLEGNDNLIGEGGDDSLLGGEGDDWLDGGTGNDTLDGGGQTWADSVDYSSALAAVTVDLASGSATGGGGSDTLIDIENVQGSQYNDQITGDANKNDLLGGAGNDSLIGGEGDDWFVGGTGNDTLDGGDGRDTSSYEDASGGVNVNLITGVASGAGVGSDQLVSIEAVHGSNFADRVQLADADGYVFGRAGNDTLLGGAEGTGFTPGSGNDSIDGGAGWDDVSYEDDGYDGAGQSTHGVTVNLASGTATDNWGNTDKLANIEQVRGSAYADSITGSAADNGFSGAAGNDTIDGGAGSDNVSYGDSPTGIVVNLATGTASDGYGGTDTLRNIESVWGSQYDDAITGSSSRNFFGGSGGDDTIDGGLGSDGVGYEDATSGVEVTIGANGSAIGDASVGSDTLVSIENVVGSVFNDALTGSDDEEVEEWFNGRAGDDTIDGRGGNDFANYQDASSAVTVDLGMETASDGEGGTDTLIDIERVRGSAYGDLLTGDDEDNRFVPGQGDDTVDGGAGVKDIVMYWDATSGVTVDLRAGVASGGGTGNDQLTAIEEAVGSAFGDHIQLADAGGYAYTQKGADTLLGGDGDDGLQGGSGNDTIDGGAGFDRVVYADDGYDDAGVSSRGVTVNLAAGTATDNWGNKDTLSEVEAVVGSDFADTLTGDAQANKLSGAEGNDTLAGGAGDDSLDAGEGVDIVDGGSGTDTLTVLGDFSAYTRTRVSESDTLLVNDDTDERITLRGIEAVVFADGEADMSQVWDNAIDALSNAWTGTDGDDSVNGLAGNDTLIGLAGDDTLIGGAGIDSLVGGAGDDRYVVDVAGDVIVELEDGGVDQVDVAFNAAGTYTLSEHVDNATITSAKAAVNLTGNDLDNQLTGNGAANVLRGADGNDVLDGGAGADTLIGGAGNDSYFVDAVGDVITEDADAGDDAVYINLAKSGTYVLAANVENARTFGTTTGVNVTGNAAGNMITNNDRATVLSGLAGDDTLSSGLGDDTLDGGVGNDSLAGGEGNDVYIVDSAADVVSEHDGAGRDRVETSLSELVLADHVENLIYTGRLGFAGTGNDEDNSLTGGAGNDTLFGLAGADTLSGGAGNDRLDGGEEGDSLVGGAGDDVYVVDSVEDSVVEARAGGSDTIETSLAELVLAEQVENIVYIGDSGFVGEGNALANRMVGGDGDDELYGLAGNDTLVGNDGDDSLDGGAGSDSLVGGGGDDAYLVDSLSDTVVEAADSGYDWVAVALSAKGTYVLPDNVEDAYLASDTAGVNITGNGEHNEIYGNGFANVLSGLAGNDSIDGDAGNDTIDGGVGDDDLVGEDGNDSMVGGDGNDSLSAGTGNDSLVGGEGDDYLDSGIGNDSLVGGSGNDWFHAGTGSDFVDGGAGDGDMLWVDGERADYDVTRLANGDLRLQNMVGSGEDITLRGVEVFAFDDGSKTLSELLDNTVGAMNDAWTGTDDADSIDGLAGNDTLSGLAGDDTLIGGTGVDSLIGGEGDDTYGVDVAGDAVVEADGQGTDQVNVAFSAAGTYTLGGNVEKATISNATAGVNLAGNELNNVLTGNAAANLLSGGAGSDTLIGGAGSDTLAGGADDDEYWIDVGSDVVNETAVGSTGVDLVKIGFTSTGSYTLAAGVEDAIVTSPGSAFAVNIKGNALDNSLTGHAGANLLQGLDGDDILLSAGGNDTLDGGSGSDTAVLDGVLADYVISRPTSTQTLFTHTVSGTAVGVAGIESIVFAGDATPSPVSLASLIAQTGSSGNDSLEGTASDDTLAGGLGDDSLLGGSGDDDLQGGAGRDVLAGGAGGDLLDGGAGNDTYQFAVGSGDDIIDQNDTVAGAIDSIEIAAPVGDLSSGETTVARGWHSYDDLVITVNSGTPGAEGVDHIVIKDFISNDLVNAGTIDQIHFSASTLSQSQILTELLKGTSSDDWLRGYADSNDSISGNAGDDTIGGAAGNDSLVGGLGSDLLYGDAGNDVLDGGAGGDQLFGGEGGDTLSGGAGNDVLVGGAGGDTYLFGAGYGQDRIADAGGGSDVDILKFNAGIRASDVSVARSGDALRVALSGGEQVLIDGYFAASGNGLVEQFSFADGSVWSATAIRAKVLVPTAGDDELYGYLGGEALKGLAGDDTINGGAGNDTLSGGVGMDSLTGGSGADRFVFDTALSETNVDTVSDFVSGTDLIGLSTEVFVGLGAVGTLVGLSDYLLYDASSGALSYDQDGAGGDDAVVFAVLGTTEHPATLGMDFMITAAIA